MTIDELTHEKTKLENAIVKLINEFNAKTGLIIYDVSFDPNITEYKVITLENMQISYFPEVKVKFQI